MIPSDFGAAASIAQAHEATRVAAHLREDLQRPEFATLTEQMRLAAAEIAARHDLAMFGPTYREIASMVEETGRKFERLLDSSHASYAMASMGALAKAINSGPYSERVVAALRDQLGDWSRVHLDDRFNDSLARPELYLQLGLEPRIAALDSAGLELLLEVTHLRQEKPPQLIPQFAPYDLRPKAESARPVAAEEDDDEDDVTERAAEDYKRILHLETQLRAFISKIMTAGVGEGWVGHCATPLVKKWKERRETARRERGREEAEEQILRYADLGDLQQIICQRQNWPLFRPFFVRKSSVEESFARLIPLRNDIAHCRPLGSSDRLYLHVEILRLCVAIGTTEMNADR